MEDVDSTVLAVAELQLLEVTEEDQEGTTLLEKPAIPQLLPEIWEVILENLAPVDFLTAINSSVEWNHLMHSKKTATLFPLVIPLIMEYFPLNTILRCRLVDKTIFKTAIDHLLQELALNPEKCFDYEPNRVQHLGTFIQGKYRLSSKLELVRKRYRFSFTEGIQRFLQRMVVVEPGQANVPNNEENYKNPFLSKFIHTSLPIRGVVDGRETAEGEAILSQLLSRVGHHVSSLHIDLFETSRRGSVIATTFFSTLATLPNLKILRLYGAIPNSELQYYRIDQLPSLPKLEYLCVKDFRWEGRFCGIGEFLEVTDAPLVLPFIQKYGQQLTVLRCQGGFLCDRNVGVELLNRLLPRLKFMKATCVNPQTMIKLGMVSWPLEKLQVMGMMERGRRCCRLGHLVKALNNFGETLTSLEVLILFPDGKGREPKDPVRKGDMKPLPKLRKFTTALQNLKKEWLWETFTRETIPKLELLEFQQVSYLREDFDHADEEYHYNRAGNGNDDDDNDTDEEEEEEDEIRIAFTLEDYKRAFGLFPSLKKIVVWFEDKRRLEIMCRVPSCRDVTCRGNC